MSWSTILQARTKDEALEKIASKESGLQHAAPALRTALAEVVGRMRNPTETERFRIETFGHVGEHASEITVRISFEVNR